MAAPIGRTPRIACMRPAGAALVRVDAPRIGAALGNHAALSVWTDLIHPDPVGIALRSWLLCVVLCALVPLLSA